MFEDGDAGWLTAAGLVGVWGAADPGPEGMGWLAGLDPREVSADVRVDLLCAFERAAAWVAACQVRVLSAMDLPTVPGVAAGPDADDWVREEVAAALHLSAVTAHRRLEVARALRDRLPGTATALAAGRIDYRKADALVEATGPLTDAAAGRVEAVVLVRAAGQTLAEMKRSVRRAVLAADPSSASDRHAAARAGRCVRLWPAEDGMADLHAHLPAEDAVRIMAAVDTLAAGRESGDPRGVDARRADALVELVTRAPGTCGDTRSGEAGGGAHIQVTVAATTLIGADERPGELAGYGPVTAGVARRLAADGRWRRFLTEPGTGRLLDYGRRTYRPPADLTRYLRARDQVCAFPGCNVPAHRADLDHTIPYPTGATSPANMGVLCRRHHRVKHETRWRLTRRPDQTCTWTSPAGKTYHVTPPGYG